MINFYKFPEVPASMKEGIFFLDTGIQEVAYDKCPNFSFLSDSPTAVDFQAIRIDNNLNQEAEIKLDESKISFDGATGTLYCTGSEDLGITLKDGNYYYKIETLTDIFRSDIVRVSPLQKLSYIDAIIVITGIPQQIILDFRVSSHNIKGEVIFDIDYGHLGFSGSETVRFEAGDTITIHATNAAPPPGDYICTITDNYGGEYLIPYTVPVEPDNCLEYEDITDCIEYEDSTETLRLEN